MDKVINLKDLTKQCFGSTTFTEDSKGTIIMGLPGSGVNFCLKSMLSYMMHDEEFRDYKFIVLPFDGIGAEYKMLGAKTVKKTNIMNMAPQCFLPLEETSGEDGNTHETLTAGEECDVLIMMLSLLTGEELTTDEKCLVEQAVNRVYKPYYEYLYDAKLHYDFDKVPLVGDLYDELSSCGLKKYTDALYCYYNDAPLGRISACGDSYRENDDFIVYDIQYSSPVYDFFCLLDIFNRVNINLYSNPTDGHSRKTVIFIEDTSRFLKNKQTEILFQRLLTRSRTLGAIVVTCTSDVKTILSSDCGRTILSLMTNAILLQQHNEDVPDIASLYNLSDEESAIIAKPSAFQLMGVAFLRGKGYFLEQFRFNPYPQPQKTEDDRKAKSEEKGKESKDNTDIKRKTAALVIPVLNEADSLAACITEVLNQKCIDKVIIVDNGSTDGSYEIAQELSKTYDNVMSVKEEVKGYGSALRKGIDVAECDYVFMADADGTYDLSVIPAMIEVLKEKDVCMGRRVRSEKTSKGIIHGFGASVLSFLGRRCCDVNVSDFHCGLRGAKRSALQKARFKCDGFEFATEYIVKLARMGCTFGEVDVPYNDAGTRETSKSKLNPVKDALRHIGYMLRRNK